MVGFCFCFKDIFWLPYVFAWTFLRQKCSSRKRKTDVILYPLPPHNGHLSATATLLCLQGGPWREVRLYKFFLVFLSVIHCTWGAVASWLVCSSSDRAVCYLVLAGDIVLCSWATHFTLTVTLFTQITRIFHLLTRFVFSFNGIPKRLHLKGENIKTYTRSKNVSFESCHCL